jgi:beta-phosphoglucomutase-like phosphatase (HAD superfamily)
MQEEQLHSLAFHFDDDLAMGFNRRKMEAERRTKADAEAEAKRATDAQVLADAEALIAAWNQRQRNRPGSQAQAAIESNVSRRGPLDGEQLSSNSQSSTNNMKLKDFCGTAGWIRTTDLLIHSQAL